MTHTVRIKRIYDSPSPDDGYRVLVDRLWPRGISKERAELNAWDRTALPPSTPLRKWFNHDPARFPEFRTQYLNELDERPEAHAFIDDVRRTLSSQNVTLLYAARDPDHNHAIVLLQWINEQLAA